MLAAHSAVCAGAKVTLVERNEKMGRKLYITGKGRCNLTNNCTADEVLQNIPRNAKFLYSAMGQFPPAKTMEFFESQGLKLKTERGNRVFPASDPVSYTHLDVYKRQGLCGADPRSGLLLHCGTAGRSGAY